jgi:hypothetical protein
MKPRLKRVKACPGRPRHGAKVALAAVVVGFALSIGSPAVAAKRGIEIAPDAQGAFEYVDDFKTPRFLSDAFLSNIGPGCWRPGEIVNCGPNRDRALTYRFYGERVIEKIAVLVEQTANGRHLGGRNTLYLSLNGLDWELVASSSEQEADANGWQQQPFTVPPQQAGKFAGTTEVWVRLVLDNYSGLQTGTSNIIRSLEVRLKVGATAAAAAEPQAAKRTLWGELRRRAGWSSISLDHADPVGRQAPHYYEDCDGWLQEAGANPQLAPDESEAFPVRRAYLGQGRSPLSLAAFVRTDGAHGRLMARIVVRATSDSSREMRVLWDGEPVAAFDAASFFDTDRDFFVGIPTSPHGGVHELRITAGDSGAILVKELAIVGAGQPAWAPKPRLPQGGRLEVLSAYYLPDPLPPADSQAVEGRHKTQEVGLIFPALQRVYEEHAQFGALRVVVRNNGKVPVRIGYPLELNGKPIEESYVNFADSAWDARGVVWYRIRPRSLRPGECAEVYVRFRRRPSGSGATLTINLENGKPIAIAIPYRPPGITIDYVTTGKTADTLYVYARRCAAAERANLAQIALDGQVLAEARICGADFPGGVALAVARLPAPLTTGDYHVVGARTDAGEAVAAQFRVQPFFFPRSSIHAPPELCSAMHMNLAMWHQRSLEACQQYHVYTTAAASDLFDLHPRVAYVMGPDEPDAHDNHGGGYEKGLGYHARRLAQSGWQELVERRMPAVASWIIINGTTRPLNWWVYGRFADIACFDPYPINSYGADHAYVRESLSLVRQGAAPNRMYACLEAFGWSPGQGVPAGARGPIAAEYRQNVVQAIGAGAKGLTSWVYAAGAGGWEGNEVIAKEIANVNALIEHIEEDLLLGAPVALAAGDAGLVATGVVGEERWWKERVWVGSLLCGPDTIVVAAANHIPASKPNPPTIEPAQNVTITVKLPDFLRQVAAFEATENGLVPFPCTVAGGKAVLRIASIESGRVFVLRKR